MAVQLNYLAPKGWKPPRSWLVTLVKIELSRKAKLEAKKQGKSLRKVFEEGAASVAAESSTGTWTKVFDGAGSGMGRAKKYRALAFDLNFKDEMFKVAYPPGLFELNNISGILAGITGNIAGMKMVSAMRVFDIRFPESIVKAFPGPKFGIAGVRKALKKPKGPLLVTVAKPKIGRSAKEQALLARTLFTSGDGSYEGIKDDENLTSLPFNTFEKRCKLVLSELKRAEKLTGNKKFYLCNTTHSNIGTVLDRANLIKKNGGVFLMLDVVTTGFAALDTVRRANTGLAIHAHRAMHGFITRDNNSGAHVRHGHIGDFSISMIVLAKIFRLLGVDSLHGGSPLAKMEDYGEAEYIRHVLQERIVLPDKKIPSLGQDWFHIRPVWMTASGGLHPGDVEAVLDSLGHDVILQCGGGLLGHPWGPEGGVIALQQARSLALSHRSVKDFVNKHPESELAAAIRLWGYGPRIVY